jgi:hypothetical protein
MSLRSDACASGWPQKASPRECPIYACNAILVRADAPTIWSFLISALHWPEWYPYSADVRIAQNAEQLGYGVYFDWRTFDVSVHSQVEEWEPNRRIAWNAKAFLASTYHRWTIQAASNGFTQVVTEETQRGPLPTLLRPYLARRLKVQHETWLQNLKCLSESYGADPSDTAP